MTRKIFRRRSAAAKIAMITVTAASAVIGATGTASAQGGGVITVCSESSYWSQVWFQAPGERSQGGIWTAPGTCSNRFVSNDGDKGWAMHVQMGNNGRNHDFGVAAFVWAGGQNYLVETYTNSNENGDKEYAINPE